MSAVNTLLVEIDGRTAKLQSALADSEARLKKFEQNTTQVGTAGDTMGQKYGMAGQRIAGAAVQMAHMGEVGVSSGKQIIGAASNIAFAFGPTGAIVGAVGISIVALIALGNRAAETAKKAREAVEAEMKTLQGSVTEMIAKGDVAGLGAAIRPEKQERDIAQQEFARLNRQLNAWREQALTAPVEREGFFRAQIAAVESAIQQAEVRLGTAEGRLRVVRDGVDAAITRANEIAALRRTANEREESDELGRKQLAEDLAALKKLQDLLRSDREKTKQDIATFMARYAAAVTKATVTLTDDIAREFNVLIAEADRLGQAAAAVELTNLRDSAVQSQRFLEGVAADLKAIEQSGKEGADLYNDLADIAARLEGELTDASLSDADRKRISGELEKVYERQAAALEGMGAATKQVTTHTDATLAASREHARAIIDAVNGALQLASAMGLVSEESARMLQSFVQIAAHIGPLTDALKGYEEGKKGSLGNLVLAATPVLGGVASVAEMVLGSSRRSAEARKAYQAEVDAWNNTLEDWARDIANAGDSFARALADIQEKHDEQQQALDKRFDRGADAPRFSDEANARLTAEQAAAQAELDRVTREATAALKGRYALEQTQINEDARVRLLRAQGSTDEADRVALTIRHERELTAARRDGHDVSALLAAQDAERARLEADIAAQQAAIAKAESDTLANLELRRLRTAGDDAGATALARQIELDAATSEAQKSLLLLIFTLEDSAQAAIDAANAQQALVDAQRAAEDLAVRNLRATGQGSAADEMAFRNRQRRELEDAADQSEEFRTQLAETQANELVQFLADRAGSASTATQSFAGGGGSASSAAPTGGRLTLAGEDRIVALLTTGNAHTRQLVDLTKIIAGLGPLAPPSVPGFSGPATSTQNTFRVTVNVGADTAAQFGGDPRRAGQILSEELWRAIERRMVRAVQDQRRASGTDAVVS